ncbi:MAG: hypothetical protein OHK0023_06960 [Anaerolineae bacterium]
MLAYWLTFGAGLLWVISIWLHSTGAPADDEITHVLEARAVWNYPHLLLDVWMRVGNTILWVIPSLFGLQGLRLTSMILGTATVLLATGCAVKLGLRREWLWLIPLFLWFQMWYADLIYTAIKSVPFTFYLTLGVYLWLSERHTPASLIFGLLPLSRHEGIVLLGLWFGYLLIRGKWRAAWLCWLPLVVYNVVYWLALQPNPADLPIAVYLQPHGAGLYGSGSWFHYLPGIGFGVGLPTLFWAMLGGPALKQVGWRALVITPYLAYFLIHTVIYRFGMYESGGYVMFLLPLSVCFALLAALGVQFLWDKLLPRLSRRWSSLTQIGIVFSVVMPQLFYGLVATQPRLMTRHEQTAVQVVDWLKTQPITSKQIWAAYPWINLLYDFTSSTPDKKHIRATSLPKVQVGDYFIWDVYYSTHRDLPLSLFINSPDWERIATFGDNQIIIFRRKGVTL